MYFPKPAINENDLAIIERGDTAEHSIEAGQYVSWKGKLGKANSAILQGATLDDSLFDYETDGMLNDLNNYVIEDRADRIGIYGGRIKSISYKSYKKYKNGFCEIYIKGKTNSIGDSATSLFTVSGENNPWLCGHFIYGGTGMLNCRVSLESSANYINKQGGAVSDNSDFIVHLIGYEFT